DGGRVSMTVGLAAVTVSLAIGGLIGLFAGYFGGWTDRILMRVIHLKLAFPGILLALIIVTVLGSCLVEVVLGLRIGVGSHQRVGPPDSHAYHRREARLPRHPSGSRHRLRPRIRPREGHERGRYRRDPPLRAGGPGLGPQHEGRALRRGRPEHRRERPPDHVR